MKRFTAETKKVINLIPSDIGRPLSDIVSNLDEMNLVEACQEVVETLTLKEAEVRTKKGLWYLMRIMPYRAEENIIKGVVVTFTDINRHKHNEQRLRDNQEQYRLLFELNPLPMWILDLETLAFLGANQAAMRSYGYSKEEFLAMTLKDLLVPEEARNLSQHRTQFDGESCKGERNLDETVEAPPQGWNHSEAEARWRPIPFKGSKPSFRFPARMTIPRASRASLLEQTKDREQVG